MHINEAVIAQKLSVAPLMGKQQQQVYIRPTSKNFFVFVLLLSFLLSLALVSFLLSSFLFVNNASMMSTGCASSTGVNSTRSSSCAGRYVYVQNLPERFNFDLVKNCHNLSCWSDMCPVVDNYGFGQLLTDGTGTLVPAGVWYGSDQFTLEIIFHNRMMRYECLTDNPAEAAAIYVPYYAALDIGRNLWNRTVEARDALMNEMLQWLRSSPEWAVRGGRDHFIVVGRATWDMRRKRDEDYYWGGKFMLMPETKNMTVLIVEARVEDSNSNTTTADIINEFGVPFPTYFHPSKMSDFITWKEKIRHIARPHLFSFTGARRKNHRAAAIRDQVIEQCVQSSRCKLLECGTYGGKCRSPVSVMGLFQNSVFCMQPPGDSYTRRSTFDSMLAGCIPVFFHHKTAHEQYKWYLPSDYTKYSVYIPEDAVRNGTVRIEDVLVAYSEEQIKAMREEIINMIPKFVYTDPRYNVEGVRDAFDITVDSVIERVRGIREETE